MLSVCAEKKWQTVAGRVAHGTENPQSKACSGNPVPGCSVLRQECFLPSLASQKMSSLRSEDVGEKAAPSDSWAMCRLSLGKPLYKVGPIS